MASFADEIREATRLLSGFNGALRKASGGGGGGGGGALSSLAGGLAGGRGFVGAAGGAGVALGLAGAAVDIANAGARMLTPAANAYAMTGSSQAFASGVTHSLLDSVEGTGIGGLILGATGISGARQTNKAAGSATADVTAALAAIGVNVSDDDRQNLFDVNQAIEGRRNQERAKVQAIADSAKELGDAKPAGAGDAFNTLVSVVTSIETLLRKAVG